MTNPTITYSHEELRTMAPKDHDRLLKELTENYVSESQRLAKEFDEQTELLQQIKADAPALVTVEIVIKTEDGKKVDRIESPMPVRTQELGKTLSSLTPKALASDLVANPTNRVKEVQQARGVREKEIAELKDHFYAQKSRIEQHKERAQRDAVTLSKLHVANSRDEGGNITTPKRGVEQRTMSDKVREQISGFVD